MSKMLLLGALTALLLVGCAPAAWEKDGVTQQEFAADSYECEKDARQSGYYGSGLVGALNMQAFNDRCMMAHGYSRSAAVTQTYSRPPAVTESEKSEAASKVAASAVCEAKGITPGDAGYYQCFTTALAAHQ